MSQFKAGDLAIIIAVRYPECEPNIGKVVEVVGSAWDGDIRVSGVLTNRDGEQVSEMESKPKNLMPLHGDFAPEQQAKAVSA